MTRRPLFGAVVTGLLLVGMISPSFATVNFSATLPLAGNPINPTYDFEKSFYLDYPQGSKLQTLLQGKNMSVIFTDNSDNDASLKTFMQQINTDIVTNEHSTAVLTSLTMSYQVLINGYSDPASFDYKILLTPTVTGYVINKASGDIPQTFDA